MDRYDKLVHRLNNLTPKDWYKFFLGAGPQKIFAPYKADGEPDVEAAFPIGWNADEIDLGMAKMVNHILQDMERGDDDV